MKTQIPVALAMTTLVLATIQPLRAEEIALTKNVAGTSVRYKVVLPNGYDPEKTYPGIIAFGGGAQSMRTVDHTLSRNFRDEAEQRGYIVIAPAAPRGQVFFRKGASIIPEFLDMVLADYKIQDRKFHIAGPSNGGIAAFHLATQNPHYFLSVTAFPGYMWERTVAKLQPCATRSCCERSRATDPRRSVIHVRSSRIETRLC